MYGKVAVRWAAADLLLAHILALVLGNNSAAHRLIFMTVGSGQQRIQTFNDTVGASWLSVEDRKRVLAVTKTLSGLLAARNDIIHSPLTISLAVEGTRIIPSTAKVLKSGKIQKLSLDRVADHVEDIGRALAQLESFWADLDDRVDPLQQDNMSFEVE